MHVLETHQPFGRWAFRMRATAIAHLANATGFRSLGEALLKMVAELALGKFGNDPRQMLYAELARAEAIID